MYYLKFASFCISVTDYCHEHSLLTLDIDLKNSSTLQSFLAYYESHHTNSISIDYELDGSQYHGRFGLLVYDHNYKARVYITTVPDDYVPSVLNYNIFNQNVISVLNNHKKSIEVIINALKRNDLLNIHDLAQLSDYLPDTDYNEIMFNHKVFDLNDYLDITNDSLDDIRNRKK